MTLEHAAGERVPVRRSPFPKEWGDRPADAGAAEIAGWARGNIAYGRALRATGVEVRWLSKTRGTDALRKLERRAIAPAIAAQYRQRQLDARR